MPSATDKKIRAFLDKPEKFLECFAKDAKFRASVLEKLQKYFVMERMFSGRMKGGADEIDCSTFAQYANEINPLISRDVFEKECNEKKGVTRQEGMQYTQNNLGLGQQNIDAITEQNEVMVSPPSPVVPSQRPPLKREDTMRNTFDAYEDGTPDYSSGRYGGKHKRKPSSSAKNGKK